MFCEMWCSDPLFKGIVQGQCQQQQNGTEIHQVWNPLRQLKKPLKKLNKDKYADIHNQQGLARRKLEVVQEMLHKNPRDRDLLDKEQECKETYNRILSSSLSLIK